MKKLLALTLVAGTAIGMATMTTACSNTEVLFSAVNDIHGDGAAGYYNNITWEKSGSDYNVSIDGFTETKPSTFAFAKNGAIAALVVVEGGKVSKATVDFIYQKTNPTALEVKFTTENNELKTTNVNAMSVTAYNATGTPNWFATANGFISKYIIGKTKEEVKNIDFTKLTILASEFEGVTGATNVTLATQVYGTWGAIVGAFEGTNKK